MQILCRVISYLLLAVFSLVDVAGVSAQTVPVLGEIQSTGKVFISSPDGKMSAATPTYPLFQDTGIKTEEGNSLVFFKDGSRVDLSRDSLIMSIHFEAPDYTIRLAQGVMVFNISSLSTLTVSTASAGILVSGGKEAVVGSITVSGKCTEVKSFAGDIQVTSPTTGPMLLTTGKNALYGDCNPVAATDPQKGGPVYSSGEIAGKYIILSGVALLVVDSLLKSPYILDTNGGHGDINRGFKIQW